MTLNKLSPFAPIPYWRLAFFYFFYFAFLGAWVPYWALYLEQVALFNAEEIGLVMGISMATRIIGPYFWGLLADSLSDRLAVIRLGALLACVCFSPLFLLPGFAWFCLSVLLFSFFWNAILSQFEALTLLHLQTQAEAYSWVRLWGSIGFIMTVLGLGYCFNLVAFISLESLLLIMWCLLVAICLSCIFVPNVSQDKPPPIVESESSNKGYAAQSFWQVFKRPQILAMFVVFFFVQLAFGPFYTFFSIYMQELAYSETEIAWYWSAGVIAEVFLFMLMASLIRIFSLKSLWLITLTISATRWFVTAEFGDEPMVLFIAQLSHAISFASMHALSMHWLKIHFSAHVQGQAQAAYSAISYGAGGALGAILSGYLWPVIAAGIFHLAAMACLIAALIVLFMPNDKPRQTLALNQ